MYERREVFYRSGGGEDTIIHVEYVNEDMRRLKCLRPS